MRVTTRGLGALMLMAILPAAANAQESEQEQPSSTLTVGVFTGGGQSALIGKPQILPMPFIFYQNEYLTFETTNLYLHPFDTGPFSFSAVGSLRISEIDFANDDRLNDFDRDFAFEVGAHASYTHGEFSLYGQFLKDVTNAHEGEEFTFGGTWQGAIGPLFLNMDAGASHRSSELGTFLYGVRAVDSAAGFALYEVESGWYPFLDASATYPISGGWSVLLNATAERLPAQAADSPIVSKRHNLMAGIGLAYSF
ncbi:MipA/OmpV family protein [Kordiimonas laminariae]|uniref:MipA/OmpV family protein n=1 Tax=Kordiimonas laminariae TaxID=2917717 RepID=UPI001FF6DF4F|nr:MipA/OmpV family protein [Kordiimonas laminariae]MCK0070745.1 MipA/OmpV family protein [Kordiimonas laminariae]